MRKYKRTFKVCSDEVQGPDSYVVFKRLTWGEMKPMMAMKEEDRAEAIVKTCTVEWNWTDDDGNPLPNPQKDPGVFDTLIGSEATWLMTHMDQEPTEDEAKN